MSKKILFIASYAASLINFRFYLLKAFIAQGYEVYACAPEDGDPINNDVAERLAHINVKFVLIPLKRTGLDPLSDLKYLFKLTSLIRSLKVSAVFSYTIKPVIYGSIAARLAGTRQIYSMITGLGYVYATNNFKCSLLRKLTTPLLKLAARCNRYIYFQNKDNLQDFCSLGIIKNINKTLIVNGSGVNVDEFTPAAYPSQMVFILVARMLKNKGIYEFIEAAQIIKKQFPETRFLIVGWEDKNPDAINKNELESLIKSSEIEYLGRLTDVRPAIAQASVFVLPSYAEGTPRSILEAMAMARPIITTDVPGCRETVIDGENGFLVPKQNSVALASAMQRFIDDQTIISRMGEKSRKMAVDKYDVHKVNQVILNSIEELA